MRKTLVGYLSAAMIVVFALPSCRSLTVVGYRNDHALSKPMGGPGFTYQIGAHIQNNVPNLQSLTVLIRSKAAGQTLEIVGLRARVKWMQGERVHTTIPYDSLWISSSDKAPSGRFYFRYYERSPGKTAFSLERLGAVIPLWWRRIPPKQYRSFDVNFAQPRCRCIPKSIDRIVLELAFELRIEGQVRKVSRTITLKPKPRSFTQVYNLKSGGWNAHRCQ